MPPESTSGTGQVPPTSQSPDSNGQVPPVSQASSSGDSDGSISSTASLTLQEALDALEKARKENAKYRKDDKRLAELEAAEQQRADAALSEKERYDKKIADLQAQVAEKDKQYQDRLVRAALTSAARELGLEPELALAIVARTAIEFSEDGDPTNAAELLAKRVADLKIVTSAPVTPSVNGANGRAAAPRQPTSVGSTPGNPARSSTSGAPAGGWNWDNMPKNQAEMDALSPAQQAAITQFINAEMARSRR